MNNIRTSTIIARQAVPISPVNDHLSEGLNIIRNGKKAVINARVQAIGAGSVRSVFLFILYEDFRIDYSPIILISFPAGTWSVISRLLRSASSAI